MAHEPSESSAHASLPDVTKTIRTARKARKKTEGRMTLRMNRELQFSRLKASDVKGDAHMQGVRTIQPSILDLIQLAVCRHGCMQVKLRDGVRDYTGSGGARASKFSVRTTFYADPLISPEKFWAVILYVCTSVCPYGCMYV